MLHNANSKDSLTYRVFRAGWIASWNCNHDAWEDDLQVMIDVAYDKFIRTFVP